MTNTKYMLKHLCYCLIMIENANIKNVCIDFWLHYFK